MDMAFNTFAVQDDRRFIVTLAFAGTDFVVCYFDRAGVITSEVHSMTSIEGAVVLVRALSGIRLAPRSRLGFDPTIFTKDGERFIQVDSQGTVDEILETVFIFRGIKGKGTVVYKCLDPEGNHVAVKDAWIDEARLYKEPEILAAIKKKGGITGILDMLAHWIVQVDGVPDSTDWIRSEFEPPSPSKIETRFHHRMVLSPYAVPINQFRSRREFLLGLRDAVKGTQKYWHSFWS